MAFSPRWRFNYFCECDYGIEEKNIKMIETMIRFSDLYGNDARRPFND